jgi:KaiC/GvpD/RAD55 family RecA-like ATPase
MPLNKSKYSEYEVEDYLADGIILLQLTERFRKVVREISIVKMRATNCNTDVFTLEYKNKKFYAMHGGKPALV